jgi:hypothetical protein
VFIVCDKKVRYSGAKMEELHVFPQPASSTIPATSICANEWLADQVLEPIRKDINSVESELDARKSYFFLIFSANSSRKNPLDLLISD